MDSVTFIKDNMKQLNPDPKTINVKTQEGLEKLKIKADYYGHYAEFLKVKELIQEIEELKIKLEKQTPENQK